MTDSRAIFLSYASQDADAARRICETLRAAGLEVWFDQSELRGGDAWDASIRKQIKECALFVPIISAHTEERLEGYFRLEWRLADQRTHLMAKGRPFLLPIVIDDTRDAGAHVPDSFLDVQWTRLPQGEASETFAKRVASLLKPFTTSPAPTTAGPAVTSIQRPARPKAETRRAKLLVAGGLGLLVVAVIALTFTQPWKSATTQEQPIPASNVSPEIKQLVAQVEDLIRDPMTTTRESYFLADELMQRVLKAENNNADYWVLAGRVSTMILMQSYDPTARRTQVFNEQIEKAAKLSSGSLAVKVLQARQYQLTGNFGEAMRMVNEILAKEPANRDALRVRAQVARLEGREAVVAEALAALQKLSGGDPYSLLFESLRLMRAARLYNAEKLLEQLLAISPTSVAYFAKVEFFKDFLADPSSAAAVVANIPAKFLREEGLGGIAAHALILTGRGDDALTLLNQVPRDYLSEFAINDPKGLFTGSAHEVSGRPAAAAAEWRGALVLVEKRLTLDPNNLPMLSSKAVLQAMLGQKSEAMDTLRLRTELGAKDSPTPLSTQSNVLVRCGKETEAIKQIRDKWGTTNFQRRSHLVRDLAHLPIYAKLRKDKYIASIIAEHYAAIKAARAAPGAAPSAKS